MPSDPDNPFVSTYVRFAVSEQGKGLADEHARIVEGFQS